MAAYNRAEAAARIFAAEFGDRLTTGEPLNQSPTNQMPQSTQNIPTPADELTQKREQRLRLILLILFRCARTAAGGMIMVALPYLVLRNLHAGSFALAMLYVIGVLSTAALSIGVGYLADRWDYGGALLLTGLMVPISAWMVYAVPPGWRIHA